MYLSSNTDNQKSKKKKNLPCPRGKKKKKLKILYPGKLTVRYKVAQNYFQH